MDRLRDPGPHPGGAAEHAVQPGVVDHLDDRPHPGALLADQPGRGGVELDLAGGVGAVAELVLQPLQAEAVALAVGRPAREEEAGEPPSAWARTRKASHIGADMNHLWPVSSYSAPGPPPFTGRATVVLARTSVPPCFSVIPIPARAPALPRRRRVARVVAGGEEARLPLGGQLRLGAQRRDHRVGHRDRAADPGLGLRHAHEGGAAGDVGAGPRVLPGRAVQLVLDRGAQQLVPGGVELDLVDAVAVAVVGLQLRRRSRWRGGRAPAARGAAGVGADGGDPPSAHSAPSRRTASTSGRSASKTL